ncbi:hypothetical protein BC940DRAFT_358775 [Gongronella butleri]|nr:hypothetical protein BC940DRAFT_358775 [Gongronella butleri]
MYQSTYRCLFFFAIHTVLALLTVITKPIQEAVQTIMEGIGVIGRVLGSPELQHVPLQLSNWTAAMEGVQHQVDQWTNSSTWLNWLDQPFEDLKSHVNASLQPPAAWDTNNNLHSVATPHAVCHSSAMARHIADAHRQTRFFFNVMVAVLTGLLFLCIVLNYVYVHHRFRYLHQVRAHILEYLTTPSEIPGVIDPPTLIRRHHINAQSALLARYGNIQQSPLIASLISFRNKVALIAAPTKWRQWLLFMTQSPAITYCLYVSVLGLTICYSCLLLVSSLPSICLTTLDDHIDQWYHNITQNATRALQTGYDAHANAANAWLSDAQTTINDQWLGSIQAFASPINNTIGAALDSISTLITDTVGGTIMEEPARDALNCLLLNKITTLQHGIEWLMTQPDVQLPQLPLILMPAFPRVSRVIPSARLVDTLASQLRTQLVIYWVLFALWALCAILGLIYVHQQHLPCLKKLACKLKNKCRSTNPEKS